MVYGDITVTNKNFGHGQKSVKCTDLQEDSGTVPVLHWGRKGRATAPPNLKALAYRCRKEHSVCQNAFPVRTPLGKVTTLLHTLQSAREGIPPHPISLRASILPPFALTTQYLYLGVNAPKCFYLESCLGRLY